MKDLPATGYLHPELYSVVILGGAAIGAVCGPVSWRHVLLTVSVVILAAVMEFLVRRLRWWDYNPRYRWRVAGIPVTNLFVGVSSALFVTVFYGLIRRWEADPDRPRPVYAGHGR